MLTITFYKGVPLQASYTNVIKFENTAEKLSFLSNYYEGELPNLPLFFGNETYIDVDTYFEGCNYLCIYDTNTTVKTHKFFFIDNVSFIAGSTVRYSITLDVWTTWAEDVNFTGATRLITGHCDALGITDAKRSLINAGFTGNCSYDILYELTRKWDEYKSATLIVEISTPNGPDILFTQVTTDDMLGDDLMGLNRQKYKLNEQLQNYVDFEIMRVYIINGVNLKLRLDAYNETVEEVTYKMYSDVYRVGDDLIWSSQQWYHIKGNENPVRQATKIELVTSTYFNETGFDAKTNKLKKRYKLGSKINNQDLTIDSESQMTVSLYMYLFSNYQIALYLEGENIVLNMSNDFQIPYVNDNFTLYMARNQASIDANNRSVAISMLSSLGMTALTMGLARATGGRTAGASLVAGAGAGVNLFGGVSQFDKQQARIEDASKQTDRVDGQYTAGLITLLEGAGLWTITYSDITEIEDTYNRFGTIQKYFTDTLFTQHRELYNFYFVQADELTINGDFTYNIKSILQSIFTNGVRIWCDASKYLLDVPYKKPVQP